MAVQARVQHGQDGRQQQEFDSEVQVEQNSLSSSRVSDQCWLRWESLRVSRRLSEQGDINGRCFEDYTCECDSVFELKSTARDSEICHACENEQDCPGGRRTFQ